MKKLNNSSFVFMIVLVLIANFTIAASTLNDQYSKDFNEFLTINNLSDGYTIDCDTNPDKVCAKGYYGNIVYVVYGENARIKPDKQLEK